MNENLDPTTKGYNPEELDLEKRLRPLSFDDFAGQDQVLENLKVFVTSNAKVTADMKATSAKYLKSAALEELMRINDDGKNIKIYVKSGSTSSKIRELLMFIEGGSSKGDDTVLMSLTGNFDLSEISVLTDKMNLPGGDALKKGTKGAKGPK